MIVLNLRNGHLNGKVKSKVSQWFGENADKKEDVQLKAFYSFIEAVDNKILPVDVVDKTDEDKCWRHYNSPAPIFRLKSAYRQLPNTSTTNNRNNKRKGNPNDKPNTPDRKRVKFNPENNPDCKYGAKCRDWINAGKCAFA